MIVCIVCCIICRASSNKKRSTVRLSAPRSSRPAIQLNTISGSQGRFTSIQQQQSSLPSKQRPPTDYPNPTVIAVQQIPCQSSASNGAKAGLCSGEPPRYNELFETN